MPRLPPSLLRQAHTANPLLTPLLRVCRDLEAAKNELRWLREHVNRVKSSQPGSYGEGIRTRRAIRDQVCLGGKDVKGEKTRMLKAMVRERASGVPLQYVLGTEWFGDLEIRCGKSVLIPRQDTAAQISHLASLVRIAFHPKAHRLRVLDLCTGTGCIPLLFEHELRQARPDMELDLLGVDISRMALDLARRNLQSVWRQQCRHTEQPCIEFARADVLASQQSAPSPINSQALSSLQSTLERSNLPQTWDILLSNPPYLSPLIYKSTKTHRSVRNFEPKLALVPPAPTSATSPKSGAKVRTREQIQTDAHHGDTFYPALIRIADDVQAKVLWMEVGDAEQAQRVVAMVKRLGKAWEGVQVWREEPGLIAEYVDGDREGALAQAESGLRDAGIDVVGRGNVRSVVCWRAEGRQWLGQ